MGSVRQIRVAPSMLSEHVRVAILFPVVPPTDIIARSKTGDTIGRGRRVTLLDRSNGDSKEVDVSIAQARILGETSLNSSEPPFGEPAVIEEEYTGMDEIVRASPEWLDAMKRRGLQDYIETCYCTPLAP